MTVSFYQKLFSFLKRVHDYILSELGLTGLRPDAEAASRYEKKIMKARSKKLTKHEDKGNEGDGSGKKGSKDGGSSSGGGSGKKPSKPSKPISTSQKLGAPGNERKRKADHGDKGPGKRARK